ncbi:MAG: hypothetical protein HKN36_03985 [Hellea sp.]|nr:hypothetical protein [Hellea sp.]
MSEQKTIPTLFWAVAGLFLLWNAFGCYMYVMEMTMSDEAYAEGFGEAMLALRPTIPTWVTGTFAIAVWVGLLGAIMFLMRKKVAFPLFVLSLLSAIVSFSYVFMNSEVQEASKMPFWVMPVIVIGMGIVEVIVSKRKIAKGILT